MKVRNYQKELDAILESQKEQKAVKRLLLHSCCAPCSSYVLAYLSDFFEITLYYYNPNINLPLEYQKRAKEQERLISRMKVKHPVHFVMGAYEPDEFARVIKGYEQEPEGGERCVRCYELRLREAAKVAKSGRYDYYTTTLSISPLKDADKLNQIGETLALEYGIAYLPSDFKKKGGYQRSTELSKEFGLYRQNYCGCAYSMPV